MAKMGRPAWPPEQEKLLRRLLPSTTIRDIARLLGRSTHAVYAKRAAIVGTDLVEQISDDERAERLMYLTERIAQCRRQLRYMTRGRSNGYSLAAPMA